jgi:hypothetical protein
MTVTTMNSVGFCAHYSKQGDWAFDFALELARRNALQLNVFHFLADPYDPGDRTGEGLSPEGRRQLIIDRERELRLYYDARLGDYLEAGFRVCEDRQWVELHRCLAKREFQILVLGHPGHDAKFAGKSLEAFAHSFVCPVVLVGPDSPTQYHLNSPARLLADRLGLGKKQWRLVEAAGIL